ncbi:PPE domain-containing protein [Haloechinothrix sp. YIM 98757]|uniref:PPE domain-containing protein n=1 Tax=Haloechinothrix aidingensis TaxID=2752311 RepID=A0A838AEJ4_9PSEU|nr:PPE domain-containing protein [Haloechinothrix aidingensis]MBA0127548.1 PPE domain-containing protein [Haloechinothrix aidingensis]
MSVPEAGRTIQRINDQRFDGYTENMLAEQIDKFRSGPGTGDIGAAVHALRRLADALRSAEQTLRTEMGKLGVHWSGDAAEQARQVLTEHADFTTEASEKIARAAELLFAQSESFNRALHKLPDAETLRAGSGGTGVGDFLGSLIGYETDQAKRAREAEAARQQAVDVLNTYAAETGEHLDGVDTVPHPGHLVLSHPTERTGEAEPSPDEPGTGTWDRGGPGVTPLHPGPAKGPSDTTASAHGDVGGPAGHDRSPGQPGGERSVPGAGQAPPASGGAPSPAQGSGPVPGGSASFSAVGGGPAGAACPPGAPGAAAPGDQQPGAKQPNGGGTAGQSAPAGTVHGTEQQPVRSASPHAMSSAAGGPGGQPGPGQGPGQGQGGVLAGSGQQHGHPARPLPGGGAPGQGGPDASPGKGRVAAPEPLAEGKLSGSEQLEQAGEVQAGSGGETGSGARPSVNTIGATATALGAAGVAGALSGEPDRKPRGERAASRVPRDYPFDDADGAEDPVTIAADEDPREHLRPAPGILEPAASEGGQDATGEGDRVRHRPVEGTDVFTDQRPVVPEVIDGAQPDVPGHPHDTGAGHEPGEYDGGDGSTR